MGVKLGLYRMIRGYIGILGLYGVHIGITEKNMETNM